MSSRDSPLLSGGTPFTGLLRVEGVAARLAARKCSREGRVRDSLDLSWRMNTSECHVTLGLTLCPGFLFFAPLPNIATGSEYATYAASWAYIMVDRRPKDRSCRRLVIIQTEMKYEAFSGYFSQTSQSRS